MKKLSLIAFLMVLMVAPGSVFAASTTFTLSVPGTYTLPVQIGDTVVVTSVLTTTDVTTPETIEGEWLVVSSGSFSQTVSSYFAPATGTFTASQTNQTLNAYIIGADS